MKLNLRFTDPCKKCLVRPSCNEKCDEYPKYIIRVIHRVKIISMSILCIIAMGFSFIATIITTHKVPIIAPVLLVIILILFGILLIIVEVTSE